jgi:hypothetical protein
VGKRSQALKRVRRWRWTVRELERSARGGQPLGNRNYVRRTDPEARRFERELVWMRSVGHSRRATGCCFESASLKIGYAAGGVRRRIAHRL